MHEYYPNVYDALRTQSNIVASIGANKLMLPGKAERKNDNKAEEFYIPAMNSTDILPGEERVRIDSLDPVGQKIFHPYTALNRIQTLVFDRAYHRSRHGDIFCGV